MGPSSTFKETSKEQLTRLFRMGRNLGMGEEALDSIKKHILAQAGRKPALEKIGASKENSFERPSDHKALKDKIHQMVEEGARWPAIEGLAWGMLAARASKKAAADLFELAYLHGTFGESLSVLEKLLDMGPVAGFYFLINPNIRTYLHLHAWHKKDREIFRAFLYPDTADNALDIEKLYIYEHLREKRDDPRAYLFFQKHKKSLILAIEGYASKLNMAKGRFYLAAARLAQECDHEKEARDLIDRIGLEDPCYQEAMQLYVKIDHHAPRGRSLLEKQLQREPSWPARLAKVHNLLREVKVSFEKRAFYPELNELFQNPLSWLPKDPEAYSHLSRLLVSYRELEPVLPKLFSVYQNNALLFHSPLLDSALWAPLLDYEASENIPLSYDKEKYWRSVASMHIYLHGQEKEDETLWQAYEGLTSLQKEKSPACLINWRKLHEKALLYVRKAPHYDEPLRQRLLKALGVFTDSSKLLDSDLLDYLNTTKNIKGPILEKLWQKASETSMPAVLKLLLAKKAKSSHYTNKDLEKLWHLAITLKEDDLAWRVLSILQSRGALVREAAYAWAVSGEKRDEYCTAPLNPYLEDKLLNDLPESEHKFLSCLLRIGPYLPDLCAILDKHVIVKKRRPRQAGSVSEMIDKHFDKLAWLIKPKKQYDFSIERPFGRGLRMPSFIQVSPKSSWSTLMLRLVDRLGISSYGFDIDLLDHLIKQAVPKEIAGRRTVLCKISRWLRRLPPEARVSWYALAPLIQKIPQKRATEIQALAVFKLALTLNQNNFASLTSLREMRVPVSYIWQFENWILSENYSKIRARYRKSVPIVIPKILTQLENII